MPALEIAPIRGHADFDRLRRGVRVRRDAFRLTFVPAGDDVLRLGFAVPRRFGSAPRRNRARRRLRHAVSDAVGRRSVPSGVALLAPTEAALDLAFVELVREIEQAFELVERRVGAS